MLAIVLGVGIGFAGSTDQIPSGVTIDGVDVSGMTASEAKQMLESRAADLASTPVVFTAAGETFSIRPKRLGVQVDWDKAIDDALAESDGFILIRGFNRLLLRIQGHDVHAAASSSQRRMNATLARFGKAVDQAPKQASIELDGLQPVVVAAKPGVVLNRERAEAVVLASLASLERQPAIQLPVDAVQPIVRAPDLAPVAAQVRKALSAPVALRYRKTTLTLRPLQFSTFLVLPKNGSKTLAIGGEAADAYFANLAKGLNRDPRDAEFVLAGNGRVRIEPSGAGRELKVKPSEAHLLAAALSSTARTGRLAVAMTAPAITTEKAKGMGITGVVSSYTTSYGGDPNRVHNVQLVANLIDDHLIAPGEVFSFNETTGDRNAEPGVPGGTGHHQRRAQDRSGRRRLPGLDHGLQRGFRCGALDRGANEPRALHQPLPDGSRRNGQLPGHRSQVHERHRSLALDQDVRRLVLADREPLRDTREPRRPDRNLTAEDRGGDPGERGSRPRQLRR